MKRRGDPFRYALLERVVAWLVYSDVHARHGGYDWRAVLRRGLREYPHQRARLRRAALHNHTAAEVAEVMDE